MNRMIKTIATAAAGVALLATTQTAIAADRTKNIIVMISDGMGYNQLAAGDLYDAGKLNAQPYEHFPFRFGMSTYPGSLSSTPDCAGASPGSYDPASAWVDFSYVMADPTDSAAAATTMATGVKTYNNAIGMDLCGQPLENVVQHAEAVGKATGVVSSVQFSHATPAGFVAHNLSRNNYDQIAREMVLNSPVDVIMGAGHPCFDNNGTPRACSYRYVGDQATWEALVAGTAGADADGDGDADPWLLVQERHEFLGLMNGSTPERVIGVPQVATTLQQSRGGDTMADPYVVPFNQNVPNLAEMTAAALNVLDNDPDGLFLMVEGGAVDWASHANQKGRTIEEQIDFNAAVQVVLDWVEQNSNWGETLVVVTGDHETGYLTGPGSNPTWEPLVNNGEGVLPGMQFNSYDHTNSLIPLFAKGDAARNLRRYADEQDPVRGPYVDNAEFGQLILQLMK